MSGELTVAERRYLKAAWYLSHDGAATVGRTAKRLGVSHAAASTTLNQLLEHGLLERGDGRELVLTDAGERVALLLVRRHRLLETFLAQVLDLSWDEVHDEAERLEWFVSDRVEERIAAVLGDPERDPHGDPIPPREGHHEEAGDLPLSQLQPGASGKIVRVADDDPALLRYLAGEGLGIGSVVTVERQEPFGGPLRLASAGGAHALGATAVGAISVSAVSHDGRSQHGG